jgi:hypothetical protein
MLAGCGGAPTAQPSTPGSSGSNPGGAAKTPPSSAQSTGTTDLSVKPITTPRPFPQVDANSAPAAVLESLAAKRAFMLVLYDSRQLHTGDQKAVVDQLAAKYRGLIDFLTYDVAKVATQGSDGTAAQKQAALATELAQKLNAGYQPVIVITDRAGQITWQSTGFYDAGTLEREILRATQ